MLNIGTLLVLIPGLPLAASLFTAALGKRVLKSKSHWPTVTAIVVSFILSLALVSQVSYEAESQRQSSSSDSTKSIGYERTYTLWTWASLDEAYSIETSLMSDSGEIQRDFTIDVTLRADPLTAIMLAMVTFVSALVAIYSIGYMDGEEGYWRFFTYISLFVFSMTMLVSVSNFVMLYVFWEAVGLCSYLLIGFWFHKPAASAAGKKAFLVNRVGDVGFALAVFLIWTTYGTLNFHDTKGADGTVTSTGVLGQTMLAHPERYHVEYDEADPQDPTESDEGSMVLLAICLLLLLGACGKSAQFPLHVWLPDAMEGPSPVSALIHAATMVTAGVYMVARCMPLFLASAEYPVRVGGVDIGALQVVAVTGALTALMAAIIALTQTDLKRVLAYSTISQLGFMFLALGTGTHLGVTAAMFHLFTHAFFKALLFLGAGSVMHSMGGVIDMRYFGGLRRLMPITWLTFVCGALALAGVFPFAGFWSKDLILAAVHDQQGNLWPGGLYQSLYYIALIAAFLTAFYTARMVFKTFYGPERIPPEAQRAPSRRLGPHESPPVMTRPLIILALAAAVVGAFFVWTGDFSEFLGQTPSVAFTEPSAASAHGNQSDHSAIAFLSTLIALGGVGLAAYLYLGESTQLQAMTQWLRPLYRLSYGKFFFDPFYLVLIVWPLRGVAHVCYAIDRWIIDGLVDFIGNIPPVVGSSLRSLQTGMVQFYALITALGTLVLISSLPDSISVWVDRAANLLLFYIEIF